MSQNTTDRNSAAAFERLFSAYDTPEKLADAPEEEIARLIQVGGLHRIKARRIKDISRLVVERYGGELGFACEEDVEAARRELLSIEGVGPKTADCVLLFSCGRDVIPVDTHVFRVTKRLGMVPEDASHEEARRILMEEIPPGMKGSVHVCLIKLGREICKARGPKHNICFLLDLCDYARKIGIYRAAEARPYTFIVDRMLGRLVAWLRILGYDTKSALDFKPSNAEDKALVEAAKKERRILVSRDRALVDAAKKAGVDAVLVKSDDVKGQLEELMKRYPLDVDPNMTRCTACNSTLREASGSDIDKIRKEAPSHLIDSRASFWICNGCGKVYWQGSHWRNILKTAEEVKSSRKAQD
ncbi:Mut7-C RNAse domain-containing protein [Methanocella conradii]|uniref:Mut7-C RNAse domain-containing protein n=1 Tax=Methanocella conradii TaxID=1175444 RepID=UPI001ED91ABD|nr:DUF5615 family PIN-like protein [Methanocella conradii]MDI6896068.1 DUF5615 family PIN-like protein [Methanocella conradii]